MKFITKHWYLNLIIGLVFIAASMYTFYYPLLSYTSAAMLFSILFLMSGLTQLTLGIANLKTQKGSGWDIFAGSITSVLGVYLMSNIGLSMETLIYFVSFYAIIKGIEQIIVATQMKTKGFGWIIISGIINIFFGTIILYNPIIGSMSVLFLISLGLFSTGWMEVLLSIQLKKKQNIEHKLGLA